MAIARLTPALAIASNTLRAPSTFVRMVRRGSRNETMAAFEITASAPRKLAARRGRSSRSATRISTSGSSSRVFVGWATVNVRAQACDQIAAEKTGGASDCDGGVGKLHGTVHSACARLRLPRK